MVECGGNQFSPIVLKNGLYSLPVTLVNACFSWSVWCYNGRTV